MQLLKRSLKVHSNVPILYYGFKKFTTPTQLKAWQFLCACCPWHEKEDFPYGYTFSKVVLSTDHFTATLPQYAIFVYFPYAACTHYITDDLFSMQGSQPGLCILLPFMWCLD